MNNLINLIKFFVHFLVEFPLEEEMCDLVIIDINRKHNIKVDIHQQIQEISIHTQIITKLERQNLILAMFFCFLS